MATWFEKRETTDREQFVCYQETFVLCALETNRIQLLQVNRQFKQLALKRFISNKRSSLLCTWRSFHPAAFHSELLLIPLPGIKFVYQHHHSFTFLKASSWVFHLLCYRLSGDFYNWMSAELQANRQLVPISSKTVWKLISMEKWMIREWNRGRSNY